MKRVLLIGDSHGGALKAGYQLLKEGKDFVNCQVDFACIWNPQRLTDRTIEIKGTKLRTSALRGNDGLIYGQFDSLNVEDFFIQPPKGYVRNNFQFFWGNSCMPDIRDYDVFCIAYGDSFFDWQYFYSDPNKAIPMSSVLLEEVCANLFAKRYKHRNPKHPINYLLREYPDRVFIVPSPLESSASPRMISSKINITKASLEVVKYNLSFASACFENGAFSFFKRFVLPDLDMIEENTLGTKKDFFEDGMLVAGLPHRRQRDYAHANKSYGKKIMSKLLFKIDSFV